MLFRLASAVTLLTGFSSIAINWTPVIPRKGWSLPHGRRDKHTVRKNFIWGPFYLTLSLHCGYISDACLLSLIGCSEWSIVTNKQNHRKTYFIIQVSWNKSCYLTLSLHCCQASGVGPLALSISLIGGGQVLTFGTWLFISQLLADK